MKRIALDAGAGTAAFRNARSNAALWPTSTARRHPCSADRGAHGAEYALQGIALIDGRTQRMPRIDLVDLQRCRIEPRIFEWPHVIGMRFAATQSAIGIDLDQHRSDLQQRIGAGLKAARLDIDHHRQEAAEAPQPSAARAPALLSRRYSRVLPARFGGTIGGSSLIDRAPFRRQPTGSPARKRNQLPGRRMDSLCGTVQAP